MKKICELFYPNQPEGQDYTLIEKVMAMVGVSVYLTPLLLVLGLALYCVFY